MKNGEWQAGVLGIAASPTPPVMLSTDAAHIIPAVAPSGTEGVGCWWGWDGALGRRAAPPGNRAAAATMETCFCCCEAYFFVVRIFLL
jgi:hypothetical protein